MEILKFWQEEFDSWSILFLLENLIAVLNEYYEQVARHSYSMVIRNFIFMLMLVVPGLHRISEILVDFHRTNDPTGPYIIQDETAFSFEFSIMPKNQFQNIDNRLIIIFNNFEDRWTFKMFLLCDWDTRFPMDFTKEIRCQQILLSPRISLLNPAVRGWWPSLWINSKFSSHCPGLKETLFNPVISLITATIEKVPVLARDKQTKLTSTPTPTRNLDTIDRSFRRENTYESSW